MKQPVSQDKTLENDICRLVLMHLPDAKLIYLFGSVADNRQTPDSDIDIAVHCDRILNPIERWNVSEKLADSLGKEVDLIDLVSASVVMCSQITTKGVCLYDPNHYADEFTMLTMSMYQNLNIERAQILSRFGSDNFGSENNG